MKKKIILMLSMIAFAICLFAISASAVEVDGIYYTLNTSKMTATVSTENRTSCTLTEVVIPEIVEYDNDGDGTKESYIVTAVAGSAFGSTSSSSSNNQYVTSIVVPRTVAEIGNHAFRNLSTIETIVIKAQGYNPTTGETSELTLNDAVFYYSSVKFVDMSESNVIAFTKVCFQGCSSLTEVRLSPNTKSIGASTFQSCSSLTTINLPNTLTYIGAEAFYGTKITGDLVLNNLTYLGKNAFRDTNISSADLSGSTFVDLGERTFNNCPNLTSVVLPSCLETIGSYAFNSSSSLTSVNLPNTLTTIQTGAFYDVPITGSFALGNITTLGENALRNTGITSIDFTGSTFTTMGKHQFRSSTSLTSIVLPATLEEIPEGTFCGCASLTSANIPSSVKILGTQCFYGTKITGDVVINYLESISKDALRGTNITSFVAKGGSSVNMGDTAFYDCKQLKYVVMPSSVTTLITNSFTNCTNLAYVVASNNLSSVSSSAFVSCSSFTSIIVAGDDISTISASFSDWSTAPFSEYDPSGTATKTIYYGAIATDDPTVYIDFTGFDKPFGTWSATTNTETTYEAVIEALGYSTNSNNTGIATGFKINQESLSHYKALFGKDIRFGIVVFNPSFIGDTLFDSEGAINASKGALQVELISSYSTLNASISGFDIANASHASLELVFAGYAYSESDRSDLQLMQKEYVGTAEASVSSPMQSKFTKGNDVLYTVKLQSVITPAQITTGKDSLNEFGA